MLLGVIFAKGVGDLIDKSLYKQAIKLKGIPMITGKLSKRAQDYSCKELMIEEVVSFNHTETVATIYDKLANCSHNGFPVTDVNNYVIGLISRNTLIAILQNKYFKDH